MARRTIENYNIAVKKNTIDNDILIESTVFKINRTMTNVEMQYIDAADEAVKYIPAKVYDRHSYFTASDDYDEIIHGLSKKAFMLFRYIKQNIIINSNYIILTHDLVGEIINEPHKSNIYKYIKELIDKKIIAKSPNAVNQFTYTINHNLFFKGSYSRFINKYINVYGEQCSDRKDADDR